MDIRNILSAASDRANAGRKLPAPFTRITPIALVLLLIISAAVLFTSCPEPLSTVTTITSFVFSAADNTALSADVTATITGTDIAATVPYGTAVTALAAAAEIPAGASIDPDPAAALDYTSPVTFTVTAADTITTADYTVTVSVAAEGANPSADTAAPTPGTLSVRSVGLETAVIEWTGAADNVTAAADLEYRLFCSESDNISTAAEAETNGTAMGSGYAAGITYETATGLAQTTAYYFTVVVRDEAGNKAAYTPVQQGTRVSVIENNPSSNTDRITAVAAEGPYVYLAGYDYDGTTGFDWRIEKRRLDTGALVAGFGTDGVVRDGLTNEDRPTSMAVYGDWLIVSGGDMSASNYEWRTRIYDKEDGSVVMGKTINPSTGEDRIEGIVVDGDYLFLAGRQYDAANGDWEMRLEKRALDTLDLVSAFGSGGVVTDDPYETTNDYYTAIAVDDSYVYAAGRTNGYLDTNICVDKYDKTTGAPDTSFGTSGRVELGSLTGYYSEGAAGIVVSGGYIYLLGGYCYTNGASPYEWNYLMLYRLDAADGSVDTVFAGGSDYITINPDGTSALTENPLAADGKYLFLVTSTNNSESADNQWYVEKRSLSSGEIPSLFNGGQPVFINYSTGAAVYENPNAVCVDDLNIFVGGSMYAADGEEWYLRILDKETGE